MPSWPPLRPLGMPLNSQVLRHPSGNDTSVNLKALPDLHVCPFIPVVLLTFVVHKTLYHLFTTKDHTPSQEKKD